MVSPSQLNEAFRLILVAKRYPKLLDNEQSFDEVLGPGRFAMTDREALELAKHFIQSSCYL
jgi:hypothetical protein